MITIATNGPAPLTAAELSALPRTTTRTEFAELWERHRGAFHYGRISRHFTYCGVNAAGGDCMCYEGFEACYCNSPEDTAPGFFGRFISRGIDGSQDVELW